MSATALLVSRCLRGQIFGVMAFCTGNVLDRVDLKNNWLPQRACSEQYESWDECEDDRRRSSTRRDNYLCLRKRILDQMTVCLEKFLPTGFFGCASSHQVGKP